MSITPGLTPVQRSVWMVINDFIQKNGTSPTYECIAERSGLKSKGRAHQIVSDLAKRGYVRLEPARQHSIIPVPPEQSSQWSEINALKAEYMELKAALAHHDDPDTLVAMADKLDGILAKLSRLEGW